MSNKRFGDEEKSEDEIDPASVIIILPNLENLKKEVEKLRTELSMLVLERDELQFVTCKNIEMAYMLTLGSLEYKAYEAESMCLRLKRKIEILQAKVNRQEKVVLSQIEKTLDAEFEEYQEKLNEQIDRMNDALSRSKLDILSDKENKELKKLYRSIVKALHPDLHPNNATAQITLFENAVIAYKDGNLATLRIISEMVCETNLPDNNEDAITQLSKEKERLNNLIKSIHADIAKIKSEYPYTVKEVVDNPEKAETRRQLLENIIAQYNGMIADYTAKIKEMMR